MEIAPSIIGKDFSEIKTLIEKVEQLVNWIQIDVSDGVFSLNKTWPYNHEGDIEELKYFLSKKLRPKFEIHLMIDKPEQIIDQWLRIKPDRILIHFESTNNIRLVIEKVVKAGIVPGIVLNLETPVDVFTQFYGLVDHIQFMNIEKLGFYGAKFEPAVLSKIKSLRFKYPSVTIGVDGGVNLENLPSLIEAGADTLVVGSSIFKSKDIKSTLEDFKKIMKNGSLARR